MNNYPKSYLIDLECPVCGRKYSPDEVQTICQDCNSPIYAQYDLEAIKRSLTKEEVARRTKGIWRWSELLPVKDAAFRITLGEGDTPLLDLQRSGRKLGTPQLYMKDESLNPTGSFKSRGLVMAMAKAIELGVESFVIPTAGNAGAALAAYAARAGVEAHVFMPKDAPKLLQLEVQMFGAELRLVDGLISDAGKLAKAESASKGWFDVSTFKEPYRAEGKKTMGLELAESFNWDLPDVILYPTGGGTGLVGMWKAFDELEKLGWIGTKRPRFVSVQAEGCAPVVRAFQQGDERAAFWEGAQTIAAGLRVPGPFADRSILSALRESHGTAIAVSDADIINSQKELMTQEGIMAAPESAATLSALKKLIDTGWIDRQEKIVLFHTGSGLLYT
jgi:threonine synthase